MDRWKKPFMLIMSVCVLAAGIAVAPTGGAFGRMPKAEAASAGETRDVILVTGKGELTIAPDVAYIALAIQTRAATAKDAQQQNADLFAKLKKVLTDKYKIDGKDLKTVGFSVNPEYTYKENESPKVKGYVAEHAVEVTYRQLDQLGMLVDDAAAAGVNRINQVRFDTEKAEEYEAQVLEKAMLNAKKKAEAIAKAANREVGAVIGVSEVGSEFRPVYTRVMDLASAAAESKASTSFESGEVKLQATLNVQYAMK